MEKPILPSFEWVAQLYIKVGEPLDAQHVSSTKRRLIPILGGEISGSAVRGKILPGGSDIQLVHEVGLIELQARYMIETEDGQRIFVENGGLRRPLDSNVSAIQTSLNMYFRSVARFEVAADKYLWLTRSLFICSGRKESNRVELTLFRVL